MSGYNARVAAAMKDPGSLLSSELPVRLKAVLLISGWFTIDRPRALVNGALLTALVGLDVLMFR
jgi:hypothetical protein